MSEQQQDIAQKIAAARHLSETLKDKIRARKEETADSTCNEFRYIILILGYIILLCVPYNIL